MNYSLKVMLASVITLYSCNGPQETPHTENNNTVVIEKKQEIPFSQRLDRIDISKADAISKAVLEFKTSHSSGGPLSCDEDFVKVKNFAIQSAMTLSDLGLLDSLKDESGSIAEADVKKFRRLGYSIRKNEGKDFFVADPEYLLSNMDECLSAPMKEFMREFITESNASALDGEVLNIPVQELERRIFFWEKFMDSNPAFILKEEAKTTYHFYLSLYMTGTGHSRAFLENGEDLNPQFKSSYENAMKNDSRTGKFIAEYYQVLKRSRFKYTPDVESFYITIKSPFAE